jgi:hypothetical protein
MHKRVYPPIASHSEGFSHASYSFFRQVHGLRADSAKAVAQEAGDVHAGVTHEFLFQREDAAAGNGDTRIHDVFFPEHSDGYLDPAGVTFLTQMSLNVLEVSRLISSTRISWLPLVGKALQRHR